MNRIFPMATSLAAAVFLIACEPEVGSERWCQSMDAKPKSSWSADDGVTYAKHCLVSGLSIGSEAWCEKRDEKPKGEWTADEAASYARHCVVKLPGGDAK